jgi:hypothetical protein
LGIGTLVDPWSHKHQVLIHQALVNGLEISVSSDERVIP